MKYSRTPITQILRYLELKFISLDKKFAEIYPDDCAVEFWFL